MDTDTKPENPLSEEAQFVEAMTEIARRQTKILAALDALLEAGPVTEGVFNAIVDEHLGGEPLGYDDEVTDRIIGALGLEDL